MFAKSTVLIGALTAVAGAAPGTEDASVQGPRELTLGEVVRIASEQASGVKIAEQGVIAAGERVDASRAQLFPRLRAEGNVFVWNEALAFTLPPIAPSTEPSSAVIRDTVTANLSLTVAQPLSALIPLFALVGIEKRGLEAAEYDRTSAKLDSAQRAVEAYFGSLQARAFLDIAEKTLAQVDAQLARAKILEKGGVLGTVDVLRIEAARAAALQAVLRARSGLQIGDRGLVLALDLPTGTAVKPVDDLPDPPPKVTLAAGAAQKAARERAEVAAARVRIEQAEGGRKVAMSALFPNIIAVATYQHNEGQGTFAQKDALFAGATLQWDLFEWGHTWDQMAEADARIVQAQLAAEAVEKSVAFDTERRSLEAGTAYETVEVAKIGLRASEEAQRIQSVLFAQGSATTTDVLDSETELARARVSYVAARYEYYVALASLARSLGKLPPASPAELAAP